MSLTETLKRTPTDCSRTLVEPAPDASHLCALVAVWCAVSSVVCVGPFENGPGPSWTLDDAPRDDDGHGGREGMWISGPAIWRIGLSFSLAFVYSHSLLVLRSHIPRRVEYCKRVGVGVTVIAEQRHSKLTRQNSAVYLPGKP